MFCTAAFADDLLIIVANPETAFPTPATICEEFQTVFNFKINSSKSGAPNISCSSASIMRAKRSLLSLGQTAPSPFWGSISLLIHVLGFH
ncbi:hypothetical protein GDO81_021003 [Engystomops pustulosus]|uniref:Reverse transcriptase domain-containing protein n=1 Tax=Engystomops pustulosus TaxID=76066 RepID=A0AAV6YR04_ENGPU|nr:hypothetical protein GDO81_021003 [Engystomops pustulosus]